MQCFILLLILENEKMYVYTDEISLFEENNNNNNDKENFSDLTFDMRISLVMIFISKNAFQSR